MTFNYILQIITRKKQLYTSKVVIFVECIGVGIFKEET